MARPAEITPPLDPAVALDRAILAVGSQKQFAQALGLTPPAIHRWRISGRVPPERVLSVERISRVPRHELRPDLYPAEDTP